MPFSPHQQSGIQYTHIYRHAVRYPLVELLADEPMHISELSRAMSEERRLVAYQLLTLEERGFVKSKYVISELDKSKGKALRVYTATDKVADVKAKLKNGLERT